MLLGFEGTNVKAKVDRKNLHVVEGKKPPAPRPNCAEDLPNANGSSHGQRSTPTSPGVAELTIAMLARCYAFVMACTHRILIADDARHGPSTIRPTRIDCAVAALVAQHTRPDIEKAAKVVTFAADEPPLCPLRR